MPMNNRRIGIGGGHPWKKRRHRAMKVDPEWLRGEAERQGLALTDDDLAFIRDQVERVKTALAERRAQDMPDVEPPYRFVPTPPRPRQKPQSRG